MGSQNRRDELKKEHLQSCKDYTCSICLCLYNKPVMLKKCQHIYCMDCFKNLFTTLKSPKTILCPICKKPTTRREYTTVNLEFQTKVENLRIYQSIIDSWDEESSDNKSKCKSANRKSYKSRLVHDISALSSDDTDTSINNEAPAIEAMKPAVKSLKISSPNGLIRKTKSLNCVITKRTPIKRKTRNRAGSHDANADELFIDDKYDSNIIIDNNSKTISNTQVINVLENCLNNYENKAATDINKLIEEEILNNIENDLESSTNNHKENDETSSGWKRMKTISKCLKQDRSYQKLNLNAAQKGKRMRNKNKNEKCKTNTNLEGKKQNKKRSTSRKTIKNDLLVEPNPVFCLDDFEIFSSNHLEQNTDLKPNRIKQELNLNALIEKVQDNENEDEIFSLATQKVAESIINKTIEVNQKQHSQHLDQITIYSSPKVQTNQIWKQANYVSSSPDILIHKDFNGDELQNKQSVFINMAQSGTSLTDDDLIISGTESSHKFKLSQVLNEMKCTSEKRTEMLSKFQSCLNSHDLFISQVSKYISSSSDSFNSDQNIRIKECFHSMPNLQASFEDQPVFSNTVIPYLKNIRKYFDRIHLMALEMNTELKHFANQFETETTESIESYLLNECDVMVQTDDLNCPNCDYSFKLNSNCNISTEHSSLIRPVQKTKRQISDDSNSTQSKRILSPTSDSEQNSTKKAKNSKYHSQFLYRHDLEVVFESDMSETTSNQTQNSNHNNNNNKTTPQIEYIKNFNLTEKPDITSNYISILEREYKNRKFPEKCEKNTEIDHLLSDFDSSNKEHSMSLFSETTKQENKSESAKISETDSNIIAATLFTNPTIQKLADILAKNKDCNDDVELDNEVANLTNIIEDSLGSENENDIFEEDVIVESTPQKLPMVRVRDESVIKNPIVELIEPPSTVQDTTVDWLCTLPPPPPPGFEDPADITFIEPHVLAKINEQNETNKVLMNSSDEKWISSLNPILLAQKGKFSPLQVKVNTTKLESKPTMLVTPKQKSILNYVSNKATSKSFTESELLIESCHSPPNEISHSTIEHQTNNKRNIVIACSRLNKDETMSILRMTSKLNVKYSRDFSKSVTHVVVTVDDRNRVKDHTIKYVLAISHSLWILSFAWVKDCLAHDRLMPEEMYEVLDVTGIPGPKLSRLTRETHPLFQNYVIYCAEPFVSLGRQDLESAIISLGGEIARSPNHLRKENNKICLILSEAKVTQDFDQYQMWRDTFNILVVDVEWLSRSVGQFQIASVRPFILCLEDDIEKLGYPYQLIAPVVGSPSQV